MSFSYYFLITSCQLRGFSMIKRRKNLGFSIRVRVFELSNKHLIDTPKSEEIYSWKHRQKSFTESDCVWCPGDLPIHHIVNGSPHEFNFVARGYFGAVDLLHQSQCQDEKCDKFLHSLVQFSQHRKKAKTRSKLLRVRPRCPRSLHSSVRSRAMTWLNWC